MPEESFKHFKHEITVLLRAFYLSKPKIDFLRELYTVSLEHLRGQNFHRQGASDVKECLIHHTTYMSPQSHFAFLLYKLTNQLATEIFFYFWVKRREQCLPGSGRSEAQSFSHGVALVGRLS